MTNVLVVDDEPSIRQLISYVLIDEGYQVDEASDGRTALERVDHSQPDIIILDMKMPGMDGNEFTRLYREQHGHAAHILILTASQDQSQPPAAANDSFLSKPFDIETLVERVAVIACKG